MGGRVVMTMPTHVLLDLDGTISDSSPGIGNSLRHACAACGLPEPTQEQVRTIIGPPFEIGLPRIGIPAGDVPRVVDAYRDHYRDVGMFQNEVYRGIPALLNELGTTMVLALATAKPQDTAERIIEHFAMTDRFALIAGATIEIGSARRTKAQVITHVLTELGLSAGPDVVMVGDRDHDVEGARANGIACVGVTWGFGSAAELTAAGAVALVDQPTDVVPALGSFYREPLR